MPSVAGLSVVLLLLPAGIFLTLSPSGSLAAVLHMCIFSFLHMNAPCVVSYSGGSVYRPRSRRFFSSNSSCVITPPSSSSLYCFSSLGMLGWGSCVTTDGLASCRAIRR